MITTTSPQGVFQMELQADSTLTADTYTAYTLSSTAMVLQRLTDVQMTRFTVDFQWLVTGEAPVIVSQPEMRSDPFGRVAWPLKGVIAKVTRLIKAGAISASGTLYVTVGAYNAVNDNGILDSYSFTLYLLSGMSYADLPMPHNKDSQELGLSQDYGYVVPPEVLLNVHHANIPITVESNLTAAYDHGKWYIDGTQATPTGERGNMVTLTAMDEELKFEYLTRSRTWRVKYLDVCSDAVVVRWTSLTGAVRQHVFPVVSQILEGDSLDVMTVGDGFRTLRNAVTGVRCRIKGLTSYGYWYYMDLLTASEVHATPAVRLDITQTAQDAFDAMMDSELTAATVSGGVGETPVGVGFFDFEFTIRFHHYDRF